jgi:hypothetical protein
MRRWRVVTYSPAIRQPIGETLALFSRRLTIVRILRALRNSYQIIERYLRSCRI